MTAQETPTPEPLDAFDIGQTDKLHALIGKRLLIYTPDTKVYMGWLELPPNIYDEDESFVIFFHDGAQMPISAKDVKLVRVETQSIHMRDNF